YLGGVNVDGIIAATVSGNRRQDRLCDQRLFGLVFLLKTCLPRFIVNRSVQLCKQTGLRECECKSKESGDRSQESGVEVQGTG
ncbi:MAG: hypothetical protein PVI73_12765, partial [Syntrophobacterales bacterium]